MNDRCPCEEVPHIARLARMLVSYFCGSSAIEYMAWSDEYKYYQVLNSIIIPFGSYNAHLISYILYPTISFSLNRTSLLNHFQLRLCLVKSSPGQRWG